MNNTQVPFSSTTATPMELGAINNYKPLSATVKEFRRLNNLCMYCGEANHQVLNCPNKPKKMQGSLGSIVNQAIINMRSGQEHVPAVKRPRLLYEEQQHLNHIRSTAMSDHFALFILPAFLYYGDDEEFVTTTEAMVDTGASSNFISSELVQRLNLEVEHNAPGEEMFFRLANNSVYVSRTTTTITLRLDNSMHEEVITLRIIEGASFELFDLDK
ncbi:hypothetical protein BD408DRAFT_459117 [Parasitella parasitica]|nr:hypothetical protein BD408DRAFT_459117 [Parasitella parasitica]